MTFGSFESSEEIEANAEINMVPFIDVMLVLLIVFMITAPLMSHAVKVNLPQASSQPLAPAAKPIDISLTANGDVQINGKASNMAELSSALNAFAKDSEVHFRADKATPYESLAQVLSACADAGLAKVGFVTELPH